MGHLVDSVDLGDQAKENGANVMDQITANRRARRSDQSITDGADGSQSRGYRVR